MLENFGTVLLAILPESDFYRVLYLIIFGVFALILFGRLKLEWIGQGLMFLWCRFLSCPLGKHSWTLASADRANSVGGFDGYYRCKYCRKTDYIANRMV